MHTPRFALVTVLAAAAALSLSAALPSRAEAFCGFYVGGAGQELYNDATMVVLMRHGERTVLSMQNKYEGPPEDFALVIPVPEVLKEEQVKTLEPGVFDKIDTLAAPRLVEYWEVDPCWVEPPPRSFRSIPRRNAIKEDVGESARGYGVKVEAQFEVGEYEVVILSAEESTGLERWLRASNYNLPDGAAPVLQPYIEGGMKFFAAKVNADKVKFQDGQAILSPLRFHYTSKDFQLPVRLGLLNARGKQDLLVHILAQNQRYEVANYPNVTVPTNLVVKEAVEDRFGAFYRALFDRVQEENPTAVVTEYAWQATSCDPCPTGSVAGGALGPEDLVTLGADVVDPAAANEQAFGQMSNWVLTRLHARYDKDELEEDLVFRAAPPIFGGRGTPDGVPGTFSEEGSKSSAFNQFQGRYAILHAWQGAIDCQQPVRGRWGGPPAGQTAGVKAAGNLGFAPPKEAVQLAQVVRDAKVPGLRAELGATTAPGANPKGTVPDANSQDPAPGAGLPEPAPPTGQAPQEARGCDRCAAATGPAPVPSGMLAGLVLLGAGAWRRRRMGCH